MPEDPVFIKMIVTTDMAERIAAGYGVRTVNVLTGFKFIGEQSGFLEKLEGLYETFGYCLNTLYSFEFEGASGQERMKSIMAYFRKDVGAFAGKKVLSCQDYLHGLDGLPRSDVLRFILEDHCSLVVRPSGTEPKLKAYISVSAKDAVAAQETKKRIAEELKRCCVS